MKLKEVEQLLQDHKAIKRRDLKLGSLIPKQIYIMLTCPSEGHRSFSGNGKWSRFRVHTSPFKQMGHSSRTRSLLFISVTITVR